MILGKVRVEVGIALCEPRTAGRCERLVMKARVGKKAETLENGTVLELLRVANHKRSIGVLTLEITGKAVSDMIDAATCVGHGEEIDNRACGIGDRNLSRAAPLIFKTEQTLFRNVMEQENGPLRGNALFGDAAGCEDDGFVEKLLGKIPVMGGCPTPNIAFAEQSGYQHPRVGQNLLVSSQLERHGRIQTGANSRQPALATPSGKDPRRFVPTCTEGPGGSPYRYGFPAGSENRGQALASGG